MEFAILIGLLLMVVWAFLTNVLLGIVVLIGVAIYYYFRRYTNLCMLMAMRAYGSGDINKGFRWFEKAAKRGMSVPQKITYAYYLLREGRVERAEDLLNAVLAFPQKGNLKYQAKSTHAILLLKTGRLIEAQEELEEIFENFRNSTVYGSLGYMYILNGDMKKAEEFNLEAYDYNKDDAVILDNMVQLYTKLGHYEKAYEYVGEIMAKNPTFVEAYYNAAIVCKELGKTEEARDYLEKALTLRVSFISAISHEDVQNLLNTLA